MVNKGQLFLIVGNAGSGKDSLLKQVLRQWPAYAKPIRIPQRYITRPPHESEPFLSLTPEEFENLKQSNFFFLTWHVYGTYYGIPISILDWLKQGQQVIVNVSREIISQAREKIPDLKVIFVEVPLEVTLQRMKTRRRESENDPAFKERLQRAKENQILEDADFIVDNSGRLETAAESLFDYLISVKPD